MLPRTINANETHKTSARGKCTVDFIGPGATADCKKCTLTAAYISENAIIHSVGMPSYKGLGNNVTFHIYDTRGNYLQTKKLDSQGRPMQVNKRDMPGYVDTTPIDRLENPRSCVML